MFSPYSIFDSLWDPGLFIFNTLQCWDQLDKQGFWKRDMAREWETKHKNSEKSEGQGTNTAPSWRCWKWIQANLLYFQPWMKEYAGS